MGCLIEVFVEIVFEAILEGYLWLMKLVVPNRTFTPKTEKALKKAVTVFSAILVIAIISGLIMLFQEDKQVAEIGKYVTFISLGMIAAQIVLGIIVRIRARK